MSCLTCRNCGFVNLVPLEPQLQNITAIHSSDSVVSQILRGSRSLLDSDCALLNAEIVKLDRLRSLYTAQLQEIEWHRRPVLKALVNRQSVYAPIRRLPRDILIEIFHSVCDSWWSKILGEDWSDRPQHHSLDVSGPLWVLGRVCGLWRDTLHTSPASWARNVVLKSPLSKYAPKILQTYLERTGEHPLSMWIVFYKDALIDDMISILIQSCYRWKNVRICTSPPHAHCLEAISCFPALQTIEISILDDYNRFDYHLDMCLKAPQLWQAIVPRQGIHRVRLPPSITHYSGRFTCREDLKLLSQLPNLRVCHISHILPESIDAPVVMAQLYHLYVNDVDILNLLTAPKLTGLTINHRRVLRPPPVLEDVAHFLRRSGCHLESLSMGRGIFGSTVLISEILSLEACSTISRLTFQASERLVDVGLALTSSVLPNLHHLILYVSLPSKDRWSVILGMVRYRRDRGMLKMVELQIADKGCVLNWSRIREDEIITDIRALAGDNLEVRVEKWNPQGREHLVHFY
ncbi:hypothetical protein EV421DRAFT_512095 [Armillaria borealis]|uniref:F-box domain-containing protein n=1 Tax=Armillaria borealis TaxID=47425 RepID=A0AA39JJV0_9AGAR|nr:hypothetical protein EV421DRAFT_512095 [Armillaria borealis]